LLETFRRHAADPIRAAAIVDLKSFIPFNLMQLADRASMAHSLELRVPFLARPLVELCLSLPAGVKTTPGDRPKPLLAAALRDGLPDFILRQPKRPFNPPVRTFMRRNLRFVDDLLLGPGARSPQILWRSFLETQVEALRSGRRDNSTFLWGLASLEHWLRRHGG
jgi:asparagine synthase (glutamine-hydrolysing)